MLMIIFEVYMMDKVQCIFGGIMALKSAKECVTIHLPNELALKMDGKISHM
jgi:hypothetical protein